MSRFITADRIHNGLRWLPEESIIEVDAAGTILAISDHTDSAATERYTGILAPGFVNAHCHLELSHMKGMIPEHTGLVPFLQQVTFHRNDFTEEQRKAERHEAFRAMQDNGIVAVGDIANTSETLDLRATDAIHFHSFVESIGFTETHQQQRFDHAVQTWSNFAAQQGNVALQQSIVPHAPYSVSPALFRLISRHAGSSVVSIHNQETQAEDRFYKDKTGAVNDLLNGFGIDSSFFIPSGKSSLQTYLGYFGADRPFIFVHNTFSSRGDVRFAMTHLEGKAYWCLCPNANLYIENSLPDVGMLMEEQARICIGTDSLASNHQLSILAELQTLRRHFPFISWETLLQWGTSNGAAAINLPELGAIAINKKPGIINIPDFEDVVVKRIA